MDKYAELEVSAGYTVWWWRGWEGEAGAAAEGGARWWRVGGEARGAALRGLACGAPYRVSVRAHNAVGASPHSRALVLRTRGDSQLLIYIILPVTYFFFSFSVTELLLIW